MRNSRRSGGQKLKTRLSFLVLLAFCPTFLSAQDASLTLFRDGTVLVRRAIPQAPGGGGRGAPAPVGTADFRPILKAEMRALDADLATAIGKTSDRMTKAHLEDARDQIKRMLEGEK